MWCSGLRNAMNRSFRLLFSGPFWYSVNHTNFDGCRVSLIFRPSLRHTVIDSGDRAYCTMRKGLSGSGVEIRISLREWRFHISHGAPAKIMASIVSSGPSISVDKIGRKKGPIPGGGPLFYLHALRLVCFRGAFTRPRPISATLGERR